MSHVLPGLLRVGHIRSRAGLRTRPSQHRVDQGHAAPPVLAAGERVLAGSGQWPLATLGTTHALYVGVDDDWRRTSWSDIASVGWSRADRHLHVQTWPKLGIPSSLRIAADARFAAFADERVKSTQLLRAHVEVLAGVSATVFAVRSHADEQVQWRFVIDRRDLANDQAVHDACANVITEMRSLAGC
jgi:hypothetical protein